VNTADAAATTTSLVDSIQFNLIECIECVLMSTVDEEAAGNTSRTQDNLHHGSHSAGQVC